jgi:serine protease Do
MHIRPHTLASVVAGLLAVGTAAGTYAADTSHVIPPIATPNYRAIVAQNQAAVVGIMAAGALRAADTGENDPFSQLFPGMPLPRRGTPHQRGVAHAQGSGFIVSADGIVLTNAHVVDGAQQVTVKLSDHREFKAKVLGADRSSDIAVLKIDAHDLPTVQLGNSDQLGVGDYVLAIGEPFGLEETATAGIVSASNSGGYECVSFDIPINLAVQVEDQIVKTGKVAHARLGVQVQTLDQSLADSFNIKVPNGALVAKVEPDSAAERAGIKVGDVILKVNDVTIVDAGQLSARIGSEMPGDKASLSIWRNGKTLTLNATIGSAATLADAGKPADAKAQLGLALRPLNPEEKSQAGVSGGLVVEDAEGHAAEAGIQPGDVVLAVDGNPVQSVAQMRKLVGEHGKQVALLIQRGENRLFVPVTLG